MEKLKVNTTDLVFIPTAGLGSRIGELTSFINKALLPILGKPIISHIIDKFPKDTKFIIPVGYKKQQIIDFCKFAYPDRNIEFVIIDHYQESFTGPGYTIKQCLDKITGPFYYIPCDSYYNESLPNFNCDTFFVKKTPQEMNHHYTTFKIKDNKILDLKFKENTPEEYYTFTGVMYINNHKGFVERLLSIDSPEIVYAIPENGFTSELNSWEDFGNLQEYIKVRKRYENYDFTKPDEVTYFANNKVLKYSKDHTIADKKYKKFLTNKSVYPENVKSENGWLVYDYFSGTTLYEHNSTSSFPFLLNYLDEKVWIKQDIDLTEDSVMFYKTKTLERINKFLEQNKDLPVVTHINDVPVKHYSHYIENIDWELLTKNLLPAYIHGDLHFDNLVIKENKFKIIDWRQEFGKCVEYGDIYYDLAKMYGGFIIDYSKIKHNDFYVKQIGSKIFIDVPHFNDHKFYIDELFNFIEKKGYNSNKVKLLLPIIYWNMSPLHKHPFDKFLWYLGIKLFEEMM